MPLQRRSIPSLCRFLIRGSNHNLDLVESKYLIRSPIRELINLTCDQNRSTVLIKVIQIFASITDPRNQFEALGQCIPVRRVHYTIELCPPHLAIAIPAKRDALMSEDPGSFAKEDEEEICQGWEAGADDTEANFDVGPELGEGTGV